MIDADAIVLEVAGRANLIGDHTDYQDGLALPFALEGLTLRLEGRLGGEQVQLRSALDGRALVLSLDGHAVAPAPDVGTGSRRPDGGRAPTSGAVPAVSGWGRYAAGVMRALGEAGHALRPLSAELSSTLPVGAGLSSSAAFELAVALAVCADELEPLELARVCQRAETEHVGVPCGLLDQLAIVGGEAGAALLLDFRNLRGESLPWPPDLAVAIVHSGLTRRLDAGAYAARRAETERAAELLGVRVLRELGPDDIPAALHALPDPLGQRVRHVVSENARVLRAADALRAGDHARLGTALAASQRSLTEDFEVSTPQLDTLVGLLSMLPGAVGARMTGAGFGGCALALLRTPVDEPALRQTLEEYRRRSGRRARCWITRPGPGIVSSPDRGIAQRGLQR
ncbi:MAG TPA: galactokinase family protein [Thermoleophilaceae bacterium]